MIIMNIDMLSLQNLFIKKCQEEDFLMKWNGEDLEFNKVVAGLIMKCIDRNLILCYSEEQKAQIQIQDYHLRVLMHLIEKKINEKNIFLLKKIYEYFIFKNCKWFQLLHIYVVYLKK